MIHVNVEYFLMRIVTQSQVLHNRTALDKFTSNKSRQPEWNKVNAGLFVGYLNLWHRNKNQSRHFWLSWFHYDPFWRVVGLRRSSETDTDTTFDSSSPHDPQIYYVTVRDSVVDWLNCEAARGASKSVGVSTNPLACPRWGPLIKATRSGWQVRQPRPTATFSIARNTFWSREKVQVYTLMGVLVKLAL